MLTRRFIFDSNCGVTDTHLNLLSHFKTQSTWMFYLKRDKNIITILVLNSQWGKKEQNHQYSV